MTFIITIAVQPAVAAESKTGAAFKDCGDCPEMVVIAPGTFMMGSLDTEKDHTKAEDPQHQVTIAHAYALAKVPVTLDQYQKFARETLRPSEKPCDYRDKTNVDDWLSDAKRDFASPGFSQTGKNPAVCVSWDDARDYIAWLNRKVNKSESKVIQRDTGPYRLPTEAEWEYAARAGTTSPYWRGDEIGRNNANCGTCGSKWDNKGTAPVGSFAPNPWGLYDMGGNVWNWVADCWHETYRDAPTDGSAITTGNCAVRPTRGGSFLTNEHDLRSAARYRWVQSGPNYSVGFRLAKNIE